MDLWRRLHFYSCFSNSLPASWQVLSGALMVIEREIDLPLYYSGLTKQAPISIGSGQVGLYKGSSAYNVTVKVSIRILAAGNEWMLIPE